jgi:hypothetical protein
MNRTSIALILAGAALLVSVAANVVAFTRSDSGIRDGSVELADLAPDTRAGLQGEKGEPGGRGPRGPRGARGPAGLPGIALPGRPGRDAPDVSDRVVALESFMSKFCGIWLITTDDPNVVDAPGNRSSVVRFWRQFC